MGCDPDNNGTYFYMAHDLPQHTFYLDAFFIDSHEVTNAEYALCVAAGVCDPPATTAPTTRLSYYDNPQYSDYPVVQVTWQNAVDC